MASPAELVPRPLDSVIWLSANLNSADESGVAATAIPAPVTSEPSAATRSQLIAVWTMRTNAGCQIAPDADKPRATRRQPFLLWRTSRVAGRTRRVCAARSTVDVRAVGSGASAMPTADADYADFVRGRAAALLR